jgi:cellulose synthase/poly-beta-1,6-N-acetylglucosamine synthase-like glycosyltransferase
MRLMSAIVFLLGLTFAVSSAIFILAQLRSVAMSVLLLITAKRGQGSKATVPPPTDVRPFVTVQIPVYRETAILARLLNAAVAIRYPAGRWDIQVIDDSEGDDAAETKRIVEQFQDRAVPVRYLHRADRTGFKSGALNFATRRTESELLALLDAEFVPGEMFLSALVDHFRETDVACVQGRFRSCGAIDSALVQLQAAVFDKMLGLEAELRRRLGLSTLSLAGGSIWRRETIVQLGGWREAPYTSEDIDLSFRAILAGWRILYDPRILADAEQVGSFAAYKIQQRKWSRGCFRNLLDHSRRAFARGHSLQDALDVSLILVQAGTAAVVPAFFSAALIALMGVEIVPWTRPIAVALSVALLLNPQLVELVIVQRTLWADWNRRAAMLLRAFPYLGGVALALFQGVVDATVSRSAEFIRTPKATAIGTIGGSRRGYTSRVRASLFLEGSFAALGLVAAASAAAAGELGFVLLLMLGSALFGASAIASFFEIKAMPARS